MSILLEIIIFVFAGCALGVITGLVPGFHINTIAAFVVAISGYLENFSAISICVMLAAMAVVHTFLGFIPSILLGAPESENVLSVLPGHKMLLQGKAIEAVKLTGVGCLLSLLITTFLFVFSVNTIPFLNSFIKGWLHLLLIFIIIVGISFEKHPWKAACIFLLSGIFGFLLLSNGIFSEEIVFPALSGMFGISTLLLSLKEKISLPEQQDSSISISFGKILKNSAMGSMAGMLVGFLPGIGPAQATYVLQQCSGKNNYKEFLVSVSGVSTANIIFTFIVLYAIGKTRSGIVIAVSKIIGNLNFQELVLLLGVVLVSGGIAFYLHMKIGVFLAKNLSSISVSAYQKLNVCIIFLVSLVVFLLTGFAGILVMLLGTAIGMLTQLINVRRAECMGFLVMPVILFYSGIGTLLLGLLKIV